MVGRRKATARFSTCGPWKPPFPRRPRQEHSIDLTAGSQEEASHKAAPARPEVVELDSDLISSGDADSMMSADEPGRQPSAVKAGSASIDAARMSNGAEEVAQQPQPAAASSGATDLHATQKAISNWVEQLQPETSDEEVPAEPRCSRALALARPVSEATRVKATAAPGPAQPSPASTDAAAIGTAQIPVSDDKEMTRQLQPAAARSGAAELGAKTETLPRALRQPSSIPMTAGFTAGAFADEFNRSSRALPAPIARAVASAWKEYAGAAKPASATPVEAKSPSSPSPPGQPGSSPDPCQAPAEAAARSEQLPAAAAQLSAGPQGSLAAAGPRALLPNATALAAAARDDRLVYKGNPVLVLRGGGAATGPAPPASAAAGGPAPSGGASPRASTMPVPAPGGVLSGMTGGLPPRSLKRRSASLRTRDATPGASSVNLEPVRTPNAYIAFYMTISDRQQAQVCNKDAML